MNNILTEVTTATSGFISAFAEGCKSMAEAFVTTSEAGAITGLSTLGIFAIAGVGLSLTGVVINFVRRLIKFR